MSNMELWNSVCVTAPHAVKPIVGKPYKGNSPKPYWLIQRATETFGPCGVGWGVTVVNERFERLTESDVLHVAMVRVWYVQGAKRGEIEQMGQTMAVYRKKDGTAMVDEEAPKKSVTDGMVKCLSMLGFAGDIFSGQWDDSKYVQWAGEETARRESPTITPIQATTVAGLMEKASADKVAFLAWVSKLAGYQITELEQTPAAALPKILAALEIKLNSITQKESE